MDCDVETCNSTREVVGEVVDVVQARHHPERERVLLVHTAGSTTEAMVIRGLLQSTGIDSPGSTSTDPFPMREAPEGFHSPEIWVLESKAPEARRIIEEYLNANCGPQAVDKNPSR